MALKEKYQMTKQNRSNFTTFDREKVEHVEEEPDQWGQSELKARLPLHGETKLTIVCLTLFAVILSLLFFFTTRAIFLLFMTLVLTLVLYGRVEAHFRKSKRTRP